MSSSDTPSEQIIVPTLRHRRILNSSNDENLSENPRVDTITTGNQEWFDLRGNRPNIRVFTSECGVDIYNIALQNCCYVRDFFTLMVKEEVLQQISDQINIYAAQR